MDLVRADVEGIYILLKSERIVYVGQSYNIEKRVAQHCEEGTKKFDAWWFYPTNNRIELEAILIRDLKPRYNAQKPRLGIWDCLNIEYDELSKKVVEDYDNKIRMLKDWKAGFYDDKLYCLLK